MIPDSLWKSAIELQRYLRSCHYEFCFIGGIAVQRWGEPRVTKDLDVTLITTFGQERPVIESLLKRYQSRQDDPVNFAIQFRILLLQDLLNTPIDLSLGGLDYEHRAVKRSSLWGPTGEANIQTCSSEDLVVLKAFASRPQDWIDVEKVIIRQGSKLDRELIEQELTPLAELKEEPEILRQLSQLFKKHPKP
jgi:hypothetical protein